ncbi:MAG: divalent-cation tolerance protein CutA [Candidatus Micrarchaeota archaeon]|nr:divalent-cation tolerance protein CutA [Candidatus Micrarchaeota archaeon]MDE1848147.1 divalent-cation tolerance protein CutA [Candidatus Micrarchaeota archaeon]MDE1864107.1 divalent-cation tolerance protein CutA [Candidatus Micrarchaeota archaeon]
MPYILVITATDSRKLAEKIADSLVEKHLAACVQINAIDSTYRWKGKIVHAREWMCTAKSKSSLYPKIEGEIKRLSSYEVPEIIAVSISRGSRPYLKWLGSTLGAKQL